MAKSQKTLSDLSKDGPTKSLSELNLAFLRKLANKLTPGNQNLTDIGQVLAVKIIGHLNLAERKLLPEQFNQSELSLALFKYFSESFFGAEVGARAKIDSTAFARILTSPLIIDPSDWPGTPEELIKWVSKTIERCRAKTSTQESPGSAFETSSSWLNQINAIGQSSLATGWAQELFSQSTQVFTPENIAQHLAAEVFEPTTDDWAHARLLDPACGAGHLLVPAAEHWLSLSKNKCDKLAGREGPTKRELLDELLSEVITGLDVDAKLLQLCGFAFYLMARDQLSELCELPLPRLFFSKSAGGSLMLGTASAENSDWFDLQGNTAPKLTAITYNQIVMNPPYLSTRIMGDTNANFLKRYYPDSAGDLYTAFIELATRLLAPGGRLSMIVQQSFLSVQRYRAFRLKLLEHCHITACLTLGPGSFSSRPGEKVNSAILTLEKKQNDNNQEIEKSETSNQKDSGNTSDTASSPRNIRVGRMENAILSSNLISEETALATMAAISGTPFAFDCPAALAKCFKELPALSEIEGIAIVNGLFTCNNKKFVKLVSQLSESEKHQYVPYDKGGGQKWYHQTNYRLLWPDNGDSIRQYRKERGQSRALPGEEFYFKPGLTYSYIGTTGFKARLLSENSIFDIASSAVFSNEIDHHYLLGFLNSSLAIYLLGVLNPTINFQIGDLRRLPFSSPTAEVANHVANLTKEAVNLMRHWHENPQGINGAELVAAERQIQEEIDTIIFQLYKIDNATETIIRGNEWVVGSRKKLLK